MKKALCIILAYAVLMTMLVVVPFTANADEKNIAETGDTIASGTTGDCTWKIEGTKLTISGNGKTGSYDNDHFSDNRAPWRNYSFTEAVIEDGVTSIGDCAFCYCTGLTSINIPDTVTGIGGFAFSGCSSLKSVTIPDSVTSIVDFAFYGCRGLTSVTIPDSVTSIGDEAFSGCSSLTSVTIPDSVTSIGVDAFCTGLTSVHINDLNAWCSIDFSYSSSNPLYYAHNLYLNDDLVTELVIPDSVTSIGKYAFSGCSSLTSVTIGKSVTIIGEDAFSGCTGLTSVDIPNSVTSIGKGAFSRCTGLKKVTLNQAGVDNFRNAFNNEYIETVTIKDSVTSIGGGAFSGCTSLTSVTIPDSVTSIGGSAFSGCSSLPSVTIPDSVTSIGGSAFSGCSSLTSVTIPDSVTSIGERAFSSCPEIKSITLSAAVTDIYEKAFGYYNREGFGESKVKGFTIYGYKNSEAERYANDNNFIFIALDDEPADPTKTTDREFFGDIDGDGEITIVDSTFIQRYLIGAQTPYPIGNKMK